MAVDARHNLGPGTGRNRRGGLITPSIAWLLDWMGCQPVGGAQCLNGAVAALGIGQRDLANVAGQFGLPRLLQMRQNAA